MIINKILEYHCHYKKSETFKNFKKDLIIFLKSFSISLLIFFSFVCYYNRDKVQAVIQFNKLKNEIKFKGIGYQLIPYFNEIYEDNNVIVDIFLIENNTILYTLNNSYINNSKAGLESILQISKDKTYNYFGGFKPLNFVEDKKSQPNMVSFENKIHLNSNNRNTKYYYKELNNSKSDCKLILIVKKDEKSTNLLVWGIAGLFCFSALFIVILNIIFFVSLKDHKQEIIDEKGIYKDEVLYIRE